MESLEPIQSSQDFRPKEEGVRLGEDRFQLQIMIMRLWGEVNALEHDEIGMKWAENAAKVFSDYVGQHEDDVINLADSESVKKLFDDMNFPNIKDGETKH